MPSSFYTDEPPLNSDCRWYCIDKLVDRFSDRMCSGHDVALDLQAALSLGQLRCMAREGPTGERRILTPEQCTALEWIWSDDCGIMVRFRETGDYYGATFYIWLPDFEALWPCGASTPMPDILPPKSIPTTPAQAPRLAEALVWISKEESIKGRKKQCAGICKDQFNLGSHVFHNQVWLVELKRRAATAASPEVEKARPHLQN